MALNRVARIARHVQEVPAAEAPICPQPTAATYADQAKSPDDVVICCAVRTPVGQSRRGNLRDTPCEEMLKPLFKAILERTKLDPKLIEDVQIGNVLQPGAGATTSRISQFLAGYPVNVAVATNNRQCSSGLQAAASIAASIRTGVIDVGLAGGVESMSMYPNMLPVKKEKMSKDAFACEIAANCLTPMGVTSENVAAKYGIPREVQDRMAVASHAKAIAAQEQGLFDSEIIPVTTTVKEKDGTVKQVTVSKDEGPRKGTSMETLAKLKPIFREGGSTTAGNASQTSDGASLCLMARRSVAQKLGLPILARFRSFAVVGVDPLLMGIGPAFAIPEALKRASLKLEDIDIFEINEAFASQATMTIDHLKIPMEKVNPKGGAIALGHPLGCTGTRQIATLLPELKRQGKKLGVCSMCIGTGMGAAGIIESEQ